MDPTFQMTYIPNILSQPQLNCHQPPPPGTQRQQYVTCSWPDFNQTLKVGVWDQQQQYEQQQQ